MHFGLLLLPAVLVAAEVPLTPPAKAAVRFAAVQPRSRLIDYRLTRAADVLAKVDETLDDFVEIIDRAGAAGCDVLAFPEDTLGLLHWEGPNLETARTVLPEAVARMLSRLGQAAAEHRMYLVLCSDTVEPDGTMHNTAFFLGRDGKDLGRYHKVNPTWTERARKPGNAFPVFETPDLGTVGMLICYDMVMPESPRCLALAGADVIFWPTLGGAAIGDGDLAVAALRTRAVENFVYIVVAQRGGGAMIVSPQGKIIAQAEGPDGLVYADVDPRTGREGGDAMNYQRDMRARLFRERNPAAFRMLIDPNPPVLRKVPIDISAEEASRLMARVLTVGEEEFNAAQALARAGKTEEAISAFERLRREYRGSWIDRVSAERLRALTAKK